MTTAVHIGSLISIDRIACMAKATSKKRSLEVVSRLLANGQPDSDPNTLFDCLFERERLGSTGLGHGVALPHCRCDQVTQTLGAFVSLADSIEFDAIDNQPVDLIFALLVPTDSTDEHLQILAQLAEIFSSESTCDALRHCKNEDDLLSVLTGQQDNAATA